MHRLSRPAILAAVVLGLGGGGAGCKGCGRSRPYVPYTVGDDAGAPASSTPMAIASASAGALDGGTFLRVPAVAAPAGATTWAAFGTSLAAPAGRVFLAGVAVEGTPRTVVAFVGDGGAMAGELLAYKVDGDGKVAPPTVLGRLPSFLPTGAGCTQAVSLSQVGRSTVFLDVAVTCDREEKGPTRWIAAFSTTQSSAARAELRLSNPAKGETLAVEADASDRDGDGSDDFMLSFALAGGVGTLPRWVRADARLAFFERGSGMVRETDQPSKSMRAAAITAASDASRKGAAEGARQSAAAQRRLFSLLCAEGGAPIVLDGAGAPFPCGDAGLVLDELRFAEGRAAVTMGDLPSAFATVARMVKEHTGAKRLQELDKALVAAAPILKAKTRPLRTATVASSVALPIAFDASGSLLVMGDQTVMKVAIDSGDEIPATDVTRWGPAAELVGDLALAPGGSDPCTGGALAVTVKGEHGHPLELPFFGGARPRCNTTPLLHLGLLDRNADGLTALLGGDAFHISPDGERASAVKIPVTPGGRGTARSPDGKWLAVTTTERVLVVGPTSAKIWKPDAFFTFTGCTVADGGKAVACALERGVVLLTP